MQKINVSAHTPPTVLVFAASDPCVGAGIQADILTLASLGCHPITAVTALTVQDTRGVHAMHAVDSVLLKQQILALLGDFQISAFKIGVLGSTENVCTVAEIIADYPDIPLIVDPVLASGRGDTLSTSSMRAAIQELLLPRTTLLTPNSQEAKKLLGNEQLSLEACAEMLINHGVKYVLITGTHENTPEVTNTLYDCSGVVRCDNWGRLPDEYHGSGCTLASAISAYIARSFSMEEAVYRGQSYTWKTLESAFSPGKGQKIPNRLFALANNDN